MFKIFTRPFSVEITKPTSIDLAKALGALIVGVALPAFIPSTSYILSMVLSAFAACATFLAGAHRNQQIRQILSTVAPIAIAFPNYRFYPGNIPSILLISYAAFIFGWLWKYWYLSNDPRRHDPKYRFFKDPQTRPQRHIIYGLLIIILLVLPVLLTMYALLTEAFSLSNSTGVIGATIFALIIFLFGLTKIIIGVVQMTRRASQRRTASSQVEIPPTLDTPPSLS